jgi:hypothetical protein
MCADLRAGREGNSPVGDGASEKTDRTCVAKFQNSWHLACYSAKVQLEFFEGILLLAKPAIVARQATVLEPKPFRHAAANRDVTDSRLAGTRPSPILPG